MKNRRNCSLIVLMFALLAAGGFSAQDSNAVNPDHIGNPPICPLWAFEPWIWEDNKNTQQVILNLVDEYQKHNIPVGAVIIDSPWETAYNDFTWDKARYPDPQAMIDQMHADDVRVIMWITGVINNTAGDVPLQKSKDFDFVIENNLTVNDGQPYTWWKGTGVHIDFTNPKARDWFGSKMAELMKMGVDGWKVDQGENTLSDTIKTSFGDMDKQVFKPYYYAALHDLSLKYNPQSLIIARPYSHQGGYAASINKCTVGWGGDYHGSFEGIVKQMGDLYTSAATGYGVLAVEVGGFWQIPPSKKSLIRYAQFGALMPVMVNGGENGGLSEHLPWFHDEQTVDVYRYYATLHSELAPYLFSCSVDSHLAGGSVVKSPDTPKAQHQLGDQIFVSPIVTADGRKTVVLPTTGQWIDYWNQQTLMSPGCELNVTVPIEKSPIYLKAGAIIPMHVKNDITGHGDTSSAGKETIMVYPYSQSTYTYHRPKGSGIEYDDVTITLDEQKGVIQVKSTVNISYRFRIKCFERPQTVTGCDSWRYDQDKHDVICDKTGSDFTLQIEPLTGYSMFSKPDNEKILAPQAGSQEASD